MSFEILVIHATVSFLSCALMHWIVNLGTSMATSLLDQFHQNLAICQSLAICKNCQSLLTLLFCFSVHVFHGNIIFFFRQLNDNQLIGSIPAELGKLEQLFELYAFISTCNPLVQY